MRVTVFAPNGREIAFRDPGMGVSFGELAAIDGQPRSASVGALSDAVLASMFRIPVAAGDPAVAGAQFNVWRTTGSAAELPVIPRSLPIKPGTVLTLARSNSPR